MNIAIATPTHLPRVECAPWCRQGDGHPDQFFTKDQWCVSAAHHIRLTAHDLQRDSDGWACETVAAYASREAYAARALVNISYNDGPEIALTTAEARELANALLVLAGAADGV